MLQCSIFPITENQLEALCIQLKNRENCTSWLPQNKRKHTVVYTSIAFRATGLPLICKASILQSDYSYSYKKHLHIVEYCTFSYYNKVKFDFCAIIIQLIRFWRNCFFIYKQLYIYNCHFIAIVNYQSQIYSIYALLDPFF